jgi:hypothetical protein
MECSSGDARGKRCPVNNAMVYCQGENCMAWHRLGNLEGYCELVRKDNK